MKEFDPRYAVLWSNIHSEPQTLELQEQEREAEQRESGDPVKSAHPVVKKYAWHSNDRGEQVESRIYLKSEGKPRYSIEHIREIVAAESAKSISGNLLLNTSCGRALVVCYKALALYLKSRNNPYGPDQTKQVAELEAAAGAISRLWLGNSGGRALIVWDDSEFTDPVTGEQKQRNEIKRDELGRAMLASVAVPGWKEYIKVGEPTFLERWFPWLAKFVRTERTAESDSAAHLARQDSGQLVDDGREEPKASVGCFGIGRKQRELNENDEQKRAQHAANEFPLKNFLMVLTILWIFEEEDSHRKNVGKCVVGLSDDDIEEEQAGSIDCDRRLWNAVGSLIHGEHFIPSDFAITPKYIEDFPVNPGARYGIFSKNRVLMNATSAWSANDKELLAKLLKQPWAQINKWEAFLQILVMPFEHVRNILADVFSDEELRNKAIAHYQSRIDIFHAQLLANPDFGNYIQRHMKEVGICKELQKHEARVYGWFSDIDRRISENTNQLLLDTYRYFSQFVSILSGERQCKAIRSLIVKLSSYLVNISELMNSSDRSEKEKSDQLLIMRDEVLRTLKSDEELQEYEGQYSSWCEEVSGRIKDEVAQLLMDAHKALVGLAEMLEGIQPAEKPIIDFVVHIRSCADKIVELATESGNTERGKKNQLLTALDDVYCYLKFKAYSNMKPDEYLSSVISRLAKISKTSEAVLLDRLHHIHQESLEIYDYCVQYGPDTQAVKNCEYAKSLLARQKLIDKAVQQVRADYTRKNKMEQKPEEGDESMSQVQHSPSRVDPMLEEKIRGKKSADLDSESYRLPLERHDSDRRRMYFGLNHGDWLSSVRAMNMAVMYTLGLNEVIESHIAVEGVWRKLEGEFYRTSDENYYKPEFEGLVRALNDKFYPAVELRVKKEIADRKKEAKGGFDLAKACYDIMSSDFGRQFDYVQQAFKNLAESNLSEPFNVVLLGAVTHCVNNTDNFDKMLYAINYANYLLQLRARMAEKAKIENGHPSTRAFDQFVDEAKMLEILQDMNAHKDATPESRGATGDAKADEELGGRASAASRHPSGRMRTQSMRYDEADESAVGDAGAAETKSADVGSRQPSSARRGAAELVHRGGASGQPALVRPRAVMVPGDVSVQPHQVLVEPAEAALGVADAEQLHPQPGTDRPAQAPSVAAPHGLHYKKVPEDQAFDWLRDLYNFNGHTESSYFQRKANVVLRAVNERAYSKLETTDVMDWIWKNVFRRNPVARKMDRLAEALFRLSELMSLATPMPDEKRIKKIDELSEFVSKVCPGKFNRTGCTVGLALSVIGGMAVLGYDEFGVEDWFADSIWYTGAAMGLIGLAVTAYSFQKNVSSAVQSMLVVLRKGQGSSCVSVCYDQVTMWADRCASGVTRGVANCFSTLFCEDEATLEDRRGGNFEAENTLGDSRAVSEQVHALHGTRP